MKIRVYPDPILRTQAKKIEEITPEIIKLGKKMIKIMEEAKGIGLAGNQIGIDKCIFVIDRSKKSKFNVVSPDEKKLSPKCQIFVNPDIIDKSGKLAEEEGCLSFPGIFGTVSRPEKIVVSALDIEGNEVEITAEGIYARAFEHEIDHLNGVLFIDKLSPASRQSIATQLKQMKKKFKKE